MQKQKVCSKCLELKNLEDFNSNKQSKDGCEGTCSKCRAENKRRIRYEKKQGTYISYFELEKRSRCFKAAATKIHGGLYVYDKVNYINNSTQVEIFCTKHQGYFWQIPNSHLSGIGCKQCGITRRAAAALKTHEEFLSNCFLKHGVKYDYSLVEYKGCKKNVTIKCNTCKTFFEQTPGTHLRGSGCPSCSCGGYSRSETGSIYVMVAGDTTKVGITNLDTTIRENYLTNSARKVVEDFPEFKCIYSRTWDDGNIAYNIEDTLLTYLREKYDTTPYKFNGSTECFTNVDLTELLSMLPTE